MRRVTTCSTSGSGYPSRVRRFVVSSTDRCRTARNAAAASITGAGSVSCARSSRLSAAASGVRRRLPTRYLCPTNINASCASAGRQVAPLKSAGQRRDSRERWGRRRSHQAARTDRLLRLGYAFDRNFNRGHLAANLRLELLCNVLIGAQELLGLLATLAKAQIAVREPRARLGQNIGCDTDV